MRHRGRCFMYEHKNFYAVDFPSRLQKDSVTSGVTGSRLESAGRYLIPLQIEKRIYIYPFSVFNNLSEDMILGIKFIVKFSLGFDPTTQNLYWSDADASWTNANLLSTERIVLKPISKFVTMNGMNHKNFRISVPGEAVDCISSDKYVIQGGPALVKINTNGQLSMEILNCSNHQIMIERDSMLGVVEKISEEDQIEEMNFNKGV